MSSVSDVNQLLGVDVELLLARAEYVEMPGLLLTVPEAQPLWGIDKTTCEVLLSTLVEDHFLKRTQFGLYRRVRR